MSRIGMVFLGYLLMINVIGIAVMAIDKWKAKHKRWRIPERRLFLISILGGSLGTLLGMYVFHHKTKHVLFMLGMPLVFILHIVLLYYVLIYHNMIRYILS